MAKIAHAALARSVFDGGRGASVCTHDEGRIDAETDQRLSEVVRLGLAGELMPRQPPPRPDRAAEPAIQRDPVEDVVVTDYERKILRGLQANPGMTANMLRAKIRCDRKRAYAALSELEEFGVVVRAKDPADRRLTRWWVRRDAPEWAIEAARCARD